MSQLEKIEKRFLEVSKLNIDLTVFPLSNNQNDQVTTNKSKSDKFGEVFTPLWLVDKMIWQGKEGLLKAKSTLDLCAGYGQFTIRMLRMLTLFKKDFDIDYFLQKVHFFNELQLESCYKLLYIFGSKINLCIGDAQKLPNLKDNQFGTLLFRSRWENVNVELFMKDKLIFKEEDMIEFKTKLEKVL